MHEANEIKSEFRFSASDLAVLLIVVGLMWVSFLLDKNYALHYEKYGIFPRTLSGLKGIVFSPFIHGDINHLFNNTVPSLALGAGLLYFYRSVALRVIFWIAVMSGFWVWVSAREAYHIGASGVIYGMVTFVFFSGVLRKSTKLLALSLLVAFLYGSLWWGILPIRTEVSWEGHLWGAISGVILAVYFRKKGPQRPRYNWEIEEELEAKRESDYNPWTSTISR